MTIDKVKLKARAEQLMAEHAGGLHDPIPAIPVTAPDVLALLAEIDELKTDRDYCKRIAVHNKEIGDQFKSENEQLRKDADRHRWLRQHEFDIGSYHGVHEHNHAAWFEHIDDEAIDRSIAEEAKFAGDNEQPDQEPQ